MLPRHLYVHAPFCARRCSYCDFAVQVSADPPVAAWARSVGLELEALTRERGWDGPLRLETLYLGGGTPSLLGPSAVDRLLAGLGGRIDRSELVELTAEANPESFTPDVASAWAAAGVNRLSFGAQTFHGPTLRWMGRLHGAEGPAAAVARARGAGITNLSLDLIFGVPERLGRDLDADLDRLLRLEPQHVSVYGLTVEPGTPLGRWVAEGKERLPPEERYREEYVRVVERLRGEGFEHYEVSNFARPGRESIHNAAYWSGAPYVGLGNGAHSYVPPERWWNHRDWDEYRESVEAGGSGRADAERVAGDAARLERIWLGLRTSDGLGQSELEPGQRELAATWRERGLATTDGGRVRLTTEGWLLLDRLAVELEGAGGRVRAERA